MAVPAVPWIRLMYTFPGYVTDPWIRLMYTFPGYVTEPLIQLIATESQILPYLDMPLQHADPKILQSMHRPSNIIEVRKTLALMRSEINDITLRLSR